MSQSDVRETKPFACSYAHDGAEWGVTIHAYDLEDAQARVKKLGYLRLNGEVKAVFPQKLGWAAKATCAVRNFFR